MIAFAAIAVTVHITIIVVGNRNQSGTCLVVIRDLFLPIENSWIYVLDDVHGSRIGGQVCDVSDNSLRLYAVFSIFTG